MSPKRSRISEGEKGERCYSDPLNSLPDELIRLILFKITDPKTLFVSSLVSKRIASILIHSQSLSLLPGEILRLIFSKITDPKTLLACFLVSKRIASILSHFQSLSLQFTTHLSFPHHFSQFPSTGYLFRRLRNLLRIFNRVRSLRIELPCPCSCPDDIVFRWKAKIGIRCVIVCFLAAKSVSKIDTKIDDKKRRSGRGGRRSRRRTASADDTGWPYFYSLNAGAPYLYASAMHRQMQLLIWRHPNLDCVELVDSKKHGKLSIGGEALIKLRTTMLDWTPENMSNFIIQPPGLEKIWYVPKLRLPVSGFEMKEVALMVSRDRKGAGCGGVWEEFEGSSDDALDGDFEDDEHGIFGEAMTQILTKHPLKTTYS